MNDMQKAQIRELRLQGFGYRKIAKRKQVCRRIPSNPTAADILYPPRSRKQNKPITACNAVNLLSRTANGRRKSSVPMPAGWLVEQPSGQGEP